MWPITAAFGALFSYNVLLILAPALAAWGAYLVCRRLTGAFWPSLVGGYLYGFSTYLVAQMHAHLNLVLVFPVPILVYLVLRRLDGSLGRVAFVSLLATTLIGLFLISTEVFASTALFGTMALLGAIALGPARLRRHLIDTVALVAVSSLVAAVVLFPYLSPALRNAPAKTIRPPEHASVDLLSFLIPRTTTLIGGDAFPSITGRFTTLITEDGAYLGVPLILALVASVIARRRFRGAWLLAGFIAVAALLSLGPVLHVDGQRSLWLPASLLGKVPLLKQATPQRFTMFMWLGVAIAIAAWLSVPGRLAVAKWGLVALSAVLLLPSVHSPPYHPERYVPPFFAEGIYRQYLQPGEIVLIVSPDRSELYWQAESGFSFRLAAGAIGVTPQRYESDAVTAGLRRSRPVPDSRPLSEFFKAHGVGALIVADPVPDGWADLFHVAGGTPQDIGGVTLVTVLPPGF